MKLFNSIYCLGKQVPSITSIVRLAALCLCLAQMPAAVSGQEVTDTIKVRTRVVFMDALVKDKKTGTPIADLKPENFELFDDGQPRTISYFTREGQARKPLAMVLILDCRQDGAGRFLKRPEVLKAITDELAKLPPGDEIGIMAMNIGEDEKRVWLTRFTNNPAEIAAALLRVPQAVADENENLPDADEVRRSVEQAKKENQGSSISISSGGDQKSDNKPVDNAQTATKPEDVVETETIKGKNGAVITRTVLKDGSVNLQRVSSSGKVIIEMNDVFDMAAAVREATRIAAAERPNSQPAIVWLSDGIAPIFYEDRDATEQILIRSNAIFSSLTTDLRTLFKFLMPIGKPIAGWVGLSIYGSAKHLAQRTGGEAVRVSRTKDFGSGLAKVIGNLTARYSLGFALREDEQDDGRMHELTLRVKAVDAKGKQRRLEVSSRRGYYMPKSNSEQTATTK